MKLFPAIDLRGGEVVRLTQGDYQQTTIYEMSPTQAAASFRAAGAQCLHVVDLDGAKEGTTPNFETIADLCASSGLFLEVGGGIRSEEVIRRYLNVGVDRVILGTAALQNPDFLRSALAAHGDKIAVGVDLAGGYVATHGWTQVSAIDAQTFLSQLQDMGVQTVIITDIAKDGALAGTNLPLYRSLVEKFNINITASGGITTLEDVQALAQMGIYGAILGKALYCGRIDLKEALEVCEKC